MYVLKTPEKTRQTILDFLVPFNAWTWQKHTFSRHVKEREISRLRTIFMGDLRAHLVEHVPHIKAESFLQRPKFKSIVGPALYVSSSLSLSFCLSCLFRLSPSKKRNVPKRHNKKTHIHLATGLLWPEYLVQLWDSDIHTRTHTHLCHPAHRCTQVALFHLFVSVSQCPTGNERCVCTADFLGRSHPEKTQNSCFTLFHLRFIFQPAAAKLLVVESYFSSPSVFLRWPWSLDHMGAGEVFHQAVRKRYTWWSVVHKADEKPCCRGLCLPVLCIVHLAWLWQPLCPKSRLSGCFVLRITFKERDAAGQTLSASSLKVHVPPYFRC